MSRLHHDLDGQAKNFSAMFPLFDIVSDAYHVPRGFPERYGTGDPLPSDYVGNLTYSFGIGPIRRVHGSRRVRDGRRDRLDTRPL